ncbi:MAG: hypothetical protein ACMXYA_01765 [Candidatus Woesearchaeota archaeon]
MKTKLYIMGFLALMTLLLPTFGNETLEQTEYLQIPIAGDLHSIDSFYKLEFRPDDQITFYRNNQPVFDLTYIGKNDSRFLFALDNKTISLSSRGRTFIHNHVFSVNREYDERVEVFVSHVSGHGQFYRTNKYENFTVLFEEEEYILTLKDIILTDDSRQSTFVMELDRNELVVPFRERFSLNDYIYISVERIYRDLYFGKTIEFKLFFHASQLERVLPSNALFINLDNQSYESILPNVQEILKEQKNISFEYDKIYSYPEERPNVSSTALIIFVQQNGKLIVLQYGTFSNDYEYYIPPYKVELREILQEEKVPLVSQELVYGFRHNHVNLLEHLKSLDNRINDDLFFEAFEKSALFVYDTSEAEDISDNTQRILREFNPGRSYYFFNIYDFTRHVSELTNDDVREKILVLIRNNSVFLHKPYDLSHTTEDFFRELELRLQNIRSDDVLSLTNIHELITQANTLNEYIEVIDEYESRISQIPSEQNPWYSFGGSHTLHKGWNLITEGPGMGVQFQNDVAQHIRAGYMYDTSSQTYIDLFTDEGSDYMSELQLQNQYIVYWVYVSQTVQVSRRYDSRAVYENIKYTPQSFIAGWNFFIEFPFLSSSYTRHGQLDVGLNDVVNDSAFKWDSYNQDWVYKPLSQIGLSTMYSPMNWGIYTPILLHYDVDFTSQYVPIQTYTVPDFPEI